MPDCKEESDCKEVSAFFLANEVVKLPNPRCDYTVWFIGDE